MALVGGDSEFDAADDLNAKVLDGIRNGSKPFSWGQPRNTPRVSAAEQQAQRESMEARQADAIARAEAAQAETAETAEDADAMFTDALTAVVEAKAADVALAPPNPHTATRADWARHEERVRADERAKLDAVANAKADPAAVDVDYFGDLIPTNDEGAADAGVQDAEDFLAAEDEVDEGFDPWPLINETLDGDEGAFDA